ncbi:MAG: c-type cytochrome [Alphaproteobacteria bacterium]|jgi:cytochrome c
MNMKLNTIAMAVLTAGLIGMVTGKATEFLYDGGPKHPGAHHEEKRGYKIEVAETTADGAPAAPVGPPDISALYATADVAAGADYFNKKCTVCHSIDKGGPNKVGPNLYGIIGRKFASHEGFSYSTAFKALSDRSWTFDEMNGFQFNPKKWVPGTIMAYAGNKKDQERANLIAFLNSKSDNPLPYPPVKAAAAPEPEKKEGVSQPPTEQPQP